MKKILALLAMILYGMPSQAQSPLIIAHRGASHEAPENTLAAVKAAWEKNIPAAEIDIHLSADGKILVMHDKNTSRTTGVSYVLAKTPAATLRTLDAGSWKDPAFRGERIPFLEEVLATIPDRGCLFIEIKCGPEVIPVLKKVLDESGRKERVAIIGFDFKVVSLAKESMPSIPVYYLKYTLKGRYNKSLIRKTREAGLDGLDLRYKGIRPSFVEAVHRAGMKLYAWTVDDPETAKELSAMGVDGITTNRPVLLSNLPGLSH